MSSSAPPAGGRRYVSQREKAKNRALRVPGDDDLRRVKASAEFVRWRNRIARLQRSISDLQFDPSTWQSFQKLSKILMAASVEPCAVETDGARGSVGGSSSSSSSSSSSAAAARGNAGARKSDKPYAEAHRVQPRVADEFKNAQRVMIDSALERIATLGVQVMSDCDFPASLRGCSLFVVEFLFDSLLPSQAVPTGSALQSLLLPPPGVIKATPAKPSFGSRGIALTSSQASSSSVPRGSATATIDIALVPFSVHTCTPACLSVTSSSSSSSSSSTSPVASTHPSSCPHTAFSRNSSTAEASSSALFVKVVTVHRNTLDSNFCGESTTSSTSVPPKTPTKSPTTASASAIKWMRFGECLAHISRSSHKSAVQIQNDIQQFCHQVQIIQREICVAEQIQRLHSLDIKESAADEYAHMVNLFETSSSGELHPGGGSGAHHDSSSAHDANHSNSSSPILISKTGSSSSSARTAGTRAAPPREVVDLTMDSDEDDDPACKSSGASAGAASSSAAADFDEDFARAVEDVDKSESMFTSLFSAPRETQVKKFYASSSSFSFRPCFTEYRESSDSSDASDATDDEEEAAESTITARPEPWSTLSLAFRQHAQLTHLWQFRKRKFFLRRDTAAGREASPIPVVVEVPSPTTWAPHLSALALPPSAVISTAASQDTHFLASPARQILPPDTIILPSSSAGASQNSRLSECFALASMSSTFVSFVAKHVESSLQYQLTSLLFEYQSVNFFEPGLQFYVHPHPRNLELPLVSTTDRPIHFPASMRNLDTHYKLVSSHAEASAHSICCDCDGDCSSPSNRSKCPCLKLLNNGDKYQWAYNQQKCLVDPENVAWEFPAIFECGPRCACSSKCRLRVISDFNSFSVNSKVSLEVFLTHGKGFGVRTREPLKKGTYICDYSGEVLNDISIEARAKKSSDVYLFNMEVLVFPDHAVQSQKLYTPDEWARLPPRGKDDSEQAAEDERELDDDEFEPEESTHHDLTRAKHALSYPLLRQQWENIRPFAPSKNEFVVDANLRGNVARFFNHSCDPNVAIVTVLKEHQDARLPRLCFFTVRPIAGGEELSVHYGLTHGVVCRCGAAECRDKDVADAVSTSTKRSKNNKGSDVDDSDDDDSQAEADMLDLTGSIPS